ncbi:MAG: acyl-CoA thioesterase [Candidatus Krumholzibacteria bacterium]
MSRTKTPAESAIETRYILAPHQVNSFGTAFGGVIMSWIDMVAAMAAQRHCQGVVVTASIDKISFKAPIHVGDHVVLKASVNYVGTTSMEVGVRVNKEDPVTGEEVRTTTAYLTFVQLDREGMPKKVTALDPQSKDEKRRYENAKQRVQARKDLRVKLKKIDT